jgi:hypothetical protein
VLCKLDVEKAYDYVNWGLLWYMLRRCAFRGEMVKVDSTLYFYNASFSFD